MSSLAAAAIIQLSVLGAQEADFDRAYQQSATTGKSLVVLIGADWCPACQRMKNSVLPQVAKDGGLSNVVFTCVDFDRQRELASRLSRAKSIPQLIRFDQTVSGWKEQLLLGAKTPTEVEAFVNAGVTVPSQEDEAVDLSGTPQTDDYKRAYNRSLTNGSAVACAPRCSVVPRLPTNEELDPFPRWPRPGAWRTLSLHMWTSISSGTSRTALAVESPYLS